MRVRTQRDDASLPAMIVVAAILATAIVGGGSIQHLGADGASIQAEPTPDPDQVKAELEREAARYRANVMALKMQFARPEVKRRLGIENGQGAERRRR